MFGIGLVLELLHAGPVRGVVARRPAEEDDRPTIRADSPFGGATDGQLAVSQSQPDVARRRWLHGAIVGERGPPSLGAGPSVLFCAVPPDDESDDDAPGFGAPLPPDDRLWRHPSELGPVAGLTDAATDTDRRTSSSAWGVAVVAGLVGAALSLGVVALAGGFQSKVVEKPVVEKVPVRAVAELAAQSAGVVGITRTVAPAVARVEVTTASGSTVGSGVMFRDDGYLVTDAHLLQSASAVQVSLADGRSLPGTVVGSDAWSAVAVIKVDAGQVPVATLGSATELQIGQTAIAIGAPDGQSGGPSVTVGVVNALGQQEESVEGVEPARHDQDRRGRRQRFHGRCAVRFERGTDRAPDHGRAARRFQPRLRRADRRRAFGRRGHHRHRLGPAHVARGRRCGCRRRRAA